MRTIVEQLLSSEISVYKISKESDVPYMTVNDLRNGKSTIDNAKFGTIEKLYTYALSLQKESPAE